MIMRCKMKGKACDAREAATRSASQVEVRGAWLVRWGFAGALPHTAVDRWGSLTLT